MLGELPKMAADWIKWVKGLSRRREVLAMARTLKKDRRVIACACMELWEWADENTVDGVVVGVTEKDIDEQVGIRGFAKSLLSTEVGWLEISSNGVRFVHWDRHNGESAKKRATETERKRQQRVTSDDVPENVGQIADKSGTKDGQKAGPEKRREEERREEPDHPTSPEDISSLALTLQKPGGAETRWGDVEWSGEPDIPDLLGQLGVWFQVVQDIMAWDLPITVEEIRAGVLSVQRSIEHGEQIADPKAVFAARLYIARGLEMPTIRKCPPEARGLLEIKRRRRA